MNALKEMCMGLFWAFVVVMAFYGLIIVELFFGFVSEIFKHGYRGLFEC